MRKLLELWNIFIFLWYGSIRNLSCSYDMFLNFQDATAVLGMIWEQNLKLLIRNVLRCSINFFLDNVPVILIVHQ